MADDNLQSFYLAGGTALSLQIGHRESTDIDLFHDDRFVSSGLANYLKNQYGADINVHKKSTVMCFINDIRVGFVAHPYEHVKPIFKEENIKMAAIDDIAAMKINAIVTNGTRLKDFVDIYFLERKFGLEPILKDYLDKYPNVNLEMAIRSLRHHDEIDTTVKIKLMGRKIKWPEVAKVLNSAVRNYERKVATHKFNDKLRDAIHTDPDQNLEKGHETGPSQEPQR
jgi:hypothetical protein